MMLPPALPATIVAAPCSLSGDIRALAVSGRTVMVRLPVGYDLLINAKRRYPVLYLLDGQNVFDDATAFAGEWHADETATRLEAAGKIVPVIIVAVYNAGAERVNEYTPVKDAKLNAGGGAVAYGKWMADTLKLAIDRAYRTKTDTANTAIGGSSLGGLFALHQSLTAPNVWGKAAVLSPSVWWAERAILQTVATAPKQPVRLWVDIGTAEDKSGNALAGAQALRDALTARGYKPGSDFSYTEAVGAAHNEAAWSARFGDALTYLFPR
ncbi:MAG: alpha/beta hydrolase [Armatimonadetes bacterium]|nr:alpha/beta hydrolase [Armatimonadota bacterium]